MPGSKRRRIRMRCRSEHVVRLGSREQFGCLADDRSTWLLVLLQRFYKFHSVLDWCIVGTGEVEPVIMLTIDYLVLLGRTCPFTQEFSELVRLIIGSSTTRSRRYFFKRRDGKRDGVAFRGRRSHGRHGVVRRALDSPPRRQK